MPDQTNTLASLVRQPGLLSGLIPRDPSVDVHAAVDTLTEVREAALAQAFLPEISAKCRAQYCDLICALVEVCRRAANPEVQSVARREEIFERLFDIYLERSYGAIAKSMRRVLGILADILRRDEGLSAGQFRDGVVERLLAVLLDQDDRVKMKAAVQALTKFLSTDSVTIERLVHRFQVRQANKLHHADGKEQLHNSFQFLLRHFFDLIHHHDLAHSAGLLLAQLISKTLKQDAVSARLPSGTPVWVEPLERSIHSNPTAVTDFYHHIFLTIFPLNAHDYLQFLRHLDLDDFISIPAIRKTSSLDVAKGDQEFRTVLLFEALRAGKTSGMLQEADLGTFIGL